MDNRSWSDVGPLAFIAEASLIMLARRICKRKKLNTHGSTPRFISCTRKSFSLDHIIQLGDLKVIIRVPADGWGNKWTAAAKSAMKSQIATLRFVKNNTSIPVSEVLEHDVDNKTEISAPFVCLSFIEGKGMLDVWFDNTGTESRSAALENRRHNILKTMAMCFSQLSLTSFKDMGCLFENDDGSVFVGPFDTGNSYLEAGFLQKQAKDSIGKALGRVLDVTRGYIPLEDAGSDFVLPLPDTDLNDILVDEEGRLVCITDWGLVTTMPRCLGYICYPTVLTRDWDPLNYRWPEDRVSENCPNDLQRYREEYHKRLSLYSSPLDHKYSAKSHIWKAVWKSCLDESGRAETCGKLVCKAVGNDRGRQMLKDMISGKFKEKEWPELNRRLRKLMAVDENGEPNGLWGISE